MVVPRLGSNQSCSCWPTPQPQQCGIQATSATYTIAHGNARSLTHWARPGIESETSWFLVRFVSTAPWREHSICSQHLLLPQWRTKTSRLLGAKGLGGGGEALLSYTVSMYLWESSYFLPLPFFMENSWKWIRNNNIHQQVEQYMQNIYWTPAEDIRFLKMQENSHKAELDKREKKGEHRKGGGREWEGGEGEREKLRWDMHPREAAVREKKFLHPGKPSHWWGDQAEQKGSFVA